MNDSKKRELLQLYLYDELPAADKRRVEEMLSASEEYRLELDELKKLHAALAHFQPAGEVERELLEARNQLRRAIRVERSRISWRERITEFLGDSVFAQYKYALGSVATVAFGFVLGYAVFSSPGERSGILLKQVAGTAQYEQGEAQFANVRFLSQDTESGIVDLTFDAITPVRVKGNVNDPRITKVLAQALVSERNPGVRMKTVSAISEQSKIQPSVEKEVKSSLITVLKYDQNPGVRKEALKALQKFPIDDDIVEAVLYVLKNEKNTGMRIAAINCLDFSKLRGLPVDKDLLDMLKQKMQSDDNNYIRIRGNAAFQEVKQ